MADPADPFVLRWRLVLGRFAEDQLPCPLDELQARMEQALDFLYGREYAERGIRMAPGARAPDKDQDRHGSLDPSQLTVPHWLAEVRRLFPQETIEIIEKHALQRYHLEELVKDPKILRSMPPNLDLLRSLLAFKGQLQGPVVQEARRVIRTVTEELRRKLETEVCNALVGRLNRYQRSPLRVAHNLDWRATIRRNLKHYDPANRRLLAPDLRFFARVRRRLPWRIIVCVDQSGSMLDSVIYSSVVAAILAGLPGIDMRLIAFDTSVVDLSGQVADPVEVLMSVQLGGGTNIGQALQYAESLVVNPPRTIVVLISDFYEGPPPGAMLAAVRRLREANAKVIALAALDEACRPQYDHDLAKRLAAAGSEVAALTPKHLAQWLGKIIS